MTVQAYPAAQAVASRARDHFARHLSAARQQGEQDLAPEPDRETIEIITNAAFWASLRREEGYVPKISLAFVPPEYAERALRFERPIKLTPEALTRLAPAVERPGIHLGVWRENAGLRQNQFAPATFPAPGSGATAETSARSSDGASAAGLSGSAAESLWFPALDSTSDSLVVWGATRTIPSLCFVLEVVAPGLLVIKHRSIQGSAKFVNVAVLEGDQVKVLDVQGANHADSPPMLREMLELDTPAAAREPVNVLVQLAVSMRAHHRGGSLLLVPAGSEAWRESIVRPISYGVSPAYSELGRLMREDPVARQERRWQEALRRVVDAVAGLTAVDGATILSDEYDLLGFGAKITRRRGAAPVEQLLASEPLDGAVVNIVAPAQLGGTRHSSAAQFAQDQRDAIAFVASQDGRFTTFAWSNSRQMVHAQRIETLLL
jgi:hypothetical protein